MTVPKPSIKLLGMFDPIDIDSRKGIATFGSDWFRYK